MSGLQQRIGLFDAVMLVAGSMIGSGVFIVSAGIARDVPSAGWLMLVWLVAGVMTVLGALAYAELAAMMPHAGGQYVYLREAYSPLFGFLYGWTSFLVIQTGTIAAVAVAFAKFLGVFLPEWGTGPDAAVGPFTRGQFVALAVIVGLTWWNARGLAGGKTLQNVVTVAKIAALLGLIAAGLLVAGRADVWSANFPQGADWLPSVTSLAVWMAAGGALVGALFSADAWNNVTFTAGETKDPGRTLPASLVLGTGLVIGLYLLANAAYLAALPLAEVAAAPDDRVGTAVMAKALPGAGTYAMAAAVMVSTFGCVNGMALMGARLTYAMARDGLFFAAVGRLNGRGVPAVALWLQAAWAGVLVFTGRYGDLLDYVICAALLFYALTVAGVFVLRWKRPDAPRPYRALGYPVLPALYVVLCLVVVADLLVVKPVYTWPGFALVLAGVPVYLLWRSLTPGVARTGEET